MGCIVGALLGALLGARVGPAVTPGSVGAAVTSTVGAGLGICVGARVGALVAGTVRVAWIVYCFVIVLSLASHSMVMMLEPMLSATLVGRATVAYANAWRERYMSVCARAVYVRVAICAHVHSLLHQIQGYIHKRATETLIILHHVTLAVQSAVVVAASESDACVVATV